MLSAKIIWMNLTKTAELIKKSFRYLVIFAASYYLLTAVIFPGSVALFKSLFAKETPPNTIYGQLDQLEFVRRKIENDNPQYVLNTTNARLPANLPATMKVYKFKPPQYSYLAGKNAAADAAVLGFTDADLISDLSGTVYKWRNSQTASYLTIDINTRVLNLTTNMDGKSLFFQPGSINKENALKKAKEKLAAIYRFNDELYPQGNQTVKLGRYSGNKLYETDSPAEAQVALIDFYRSIDKYPILGPNPSEGLMRMIVSNRSGKSDPLVNPIVEANYWEINTATKAVYPIIDVKEAWKMVTDNKAVIVQVTPKNANPFGTYTPVTVEKILIDNIYLAYYETPKFQTYLQPIYVFSGKYTTRGTEGGSITLYFPAITGEWSKSSQPQIPTPVK